ncbi:MAG: tetratricopeptide repeat protein [Leptospirillum sp.]
MHLRLLSVLRWSPRPSALRLRPDPPIRTYRHSGPRRKGRDAAAQYKLGMIYENGKVVPLDVEKVAHCFRLTAKQGYAPAQFNLGQLYTIGWGVPQD